MFNRTYILICSFWILHVFIILNVVSVNCLSSWVVHVLVLTREAAWFPTKDHGMTKKSWRLPSISGLLFQIYDYETNSSLLDLFKDIISRIQSLRAVFPTLFWWTRWFVTVTTNVPTKLLLLLMRRLLERMRIQRRAILLNCQLNLPELHALIPILLLFMRKWVLLDLWMSTIFF